jgi:small subunit ribosomal protein S18
MIDKKKKEETVLPEVRYFDYKDVDTLQRFLNPHGRIQSRKITNLRAKQQRDLARAVKNARFMGLIPYTVT